MKEEIKAGLSSLLEKAVNFCMESGVKLIIAIIILIIGFKLVDMFGKRFKKSKFYDRLDPTARTFFRSFLTIALKIVLIIIAAIIIGIPMASLVAVIGSAGLAIGLALQGSLSNIAGGFIILVFKPFKVGDFISTADAVGTVEAINIFYTKVTTNDNKVIHIPNSVISNQTLTDLSTKELRRVDLTFSTAYTCDIDEVKKILLNSAAKHELILSNPAPEVYLSEHAASSLNFILKAWCKNSDYWTVYYDLMENVKKEFDKNHIEIPYQKIDVHVDSTTSQ